MRVRNRVGVLLLGSLLAGTPALAEADAAEVRWERSLKTALAASAASGRPVLVDVWAIWCVPCKKMDETTYRDPEVVRAAANFVPVKVDHDVQELFVERHGIDALPLVLFLDAGGREISRIAGLLAAEELLQAMTAVQQGYAAYLAALELPSDPAAAQVIGSYLLAAGNPTRAAEALRRGLKDLGGPARQPLELRLAEALLAAEEFKPAAETFARLASGGGDPELLGSALAGLVRAERGRGRTAAAGQALERLRLEFPERAAAFDATPWPSPDGSQD